MTWKDEIKKEIDDRENYILTAINEGIQIALRNNRTVRGSNSSSISPADKNLLESISIELERAKDRLDKIMRLSPKEPITETRADPEYRD